MATQQPDLSFKVLSLLSKERGIYGLRNGDHERYRHHCANKLHRLRQVSGLTSGKGKAYKKPPPLTKEAVKDVRQLHLLLFSAERALAHSHELKALATKPNPPANVRREQISWLRRAAKYASSLYDIARSLSESSQLSQRTLSEITIYHLSVASELSFERQQWAEALTSLACRRHLLSNLALGARDSYDQALATEFIDAYDPLIRFSAYKMGRAESHDIDGVVADIDNEMMEEALPGFAQLVQGLREELKVSEVEDGRKTLDEVNFAGDKVEFRNAEMVGIMLRVQDVLGKMQGKRDGGKGRGMKGWDRVLGVLGEAEGVARRLLDDHEASRSATSLRSTETSKSLSLAHQYIIYLLLSHRIQRDLLLVTALESSAAVLPSDATSFKISGGRGKVEDAVKSLAAIIKLYDTVLQSMSQVRSLAIVEEKDGVRLAAEGVEAFFHATKCYHLARLHCIHPTPSYASAVQLLERSSLSVRQAKTALFDSMTDLQEAIVPLTELQVDELGSRVAELDLAAKRALFAERVPKPVFFDTAFNYIDLPMDELLVKAGKKEAVAQPVISRVEAAVSQTKKSVLPRERETRETTPAVEDRQGASKPKGWFGGWLGRG
ncbi:hypothetical protein BCR39DRAFT_469451 [Naematelia encephala]|uniref:Signal recognition particle subunit SRP68 n=1 Tax=Naematelia encephala TaxID=71784 RepID=A0A1Y2AXS6_9TREE|nr:hypothetical protein BCR39DRAFT_469451 [Naematelia encephala]